MTREPDRSAEDRTTRAEFRAFVRENHPDVGGDPQEFVTGLARFGQGRTRFTARDSGIEQESDRYDAPVFFTSREGGVVGRVKRWRQRRRRPPRVR